MKIGKMLGVKREASSTNVVPVIGAGVLAASHMASPLEVKAALQWWIDNFDTMGKNFWSFHEASLRSVGKVGTFIGSVCDIVAADPATHTEQPELWTSARVGDLVKLNVANRERLWFRVWEKQTEPSVMYRVVLENNPVSLPIVLGSEAVVGPEHVLEIERG